MKFKKEYLILAVLIVALLLYLFFHRDNGSLYKLPSIPTVSASEFTKIEITGPKEHIIMEKHDGKWKTSPQGYPLDDRKLKEILDSIDDLELTALISESKAYERYELDKEEKIHVRAWAGEDLKRDLDVGKLAPSYSHTFIKLAGDDRVYHVAGNLKREFDKSLDDIRDKTALRIDQEKIQMVEITKDGETLTMTKESEPVNEDETTDTEVGEKSTGDQEKEETSREPEIRWVTSDGKEAEKSKVRELLTSLYELNCASYLQGKEKKDYIDPIYTVRLQDDKEYTISLYSPIEKKDNKEYPAISSENDYPFLLYGYIGKNIMMPLEDFLTKPEKE